MTWHTGTMHGFDLESDSPNPEDARIITACIGIASPEGWTARTWLLQPERDIPEGATAIHGITTEMARIDGTDRTEGIAAIAAALAAAWAAGQPVVTHNGVYDLTVLDRELRRIGAQPLTIDGPVIDTLTLDKAVDRYRKGSRRLADVASHYRLGTVDAHDAEADARAACRIAWRLSKCRLSEKRDPALWAGDLGDEGHQVPWPPTLGDLALRDLHAFQVGAYAEQRRSFAEYRRRKGQPLDDESTDWPLRPYRQEKAAWLEGKP